MKNSNNTNNTSKNTNNTSKNTKTELKKKGQGGRGRVEGATSMNLVSCKALYKLADKDVQIPIGRRFCDAMGIKGKPFPSNHHTLRNLIGEAKNKLEETVEISTTKEEKESLPTV